jgi:DHA1 family bicyclomycin/chloramphenicol resistance-like MFS transporter
MTDHTVSAVAAAPRPEVSSTLSQITVLAALAATGTLATNILLPSLPQMAASLHVTTAEVTASITVFLAVFAIGQLAVGPISDRYGRRWPVLSGFAVFVAGSVWCGLAKDLPELLLGRVTRPQAPVPPRCCRARSPAICSAALRSAARWR